MLHLDPETLVIIESEADGRFTFQVKFKGAVGPTSSSPMSNREDVELLGNTLVRHLKRNYEQWLGLATL